MSETKARKASITDVIKLVIVSGFPIIFMLLAIVILSLYPNFIETKDPATMSEAFKSFIGYSTLTAIGTVILGLFFFNRAFRYKFYIDSYNDVVQGGRTPYGTSPEGHAIHKRKMRKYLIAAGVASIVFLASFVSWCFYMASFLDVLKFTGLVAILVFNLWWRFVTFG